MTRTHSRRLLSIVSGLAGALSAACAAPSDAGWTLADLGPGRCVGVNAAGQVLGVDEREGTFLISREGARAPLGGFVGSVRMVGVALSASGDVVGYGVGPDARVAVAYRGGAWAPIAAAPGDFSAAIGIDDEGQIVGVSGSSAGAGMRAFLISSGVRADLPLPPRSSAAYLVGAEGRIAGILETPSRETHAFVLTRGALTDLGTLGGATSTPYGMNRRGDIVGAAESAAGQRRAFLASADGGMVDLGLPPGMTSAEARGVDDQGRIAGNAYDASGLSRPVAFAVRNAPVDLLPADTLHNLYASAYAVSMAPDGQIAGWATLTDGTVHCLRWTPGGER